MMDVDDVSEVVQGWPDPATNSKKFGFPCSKPPNINWNDHCHGASRIIARKYFFRHICLVSNMFQLAMDAMHDCCCLELPPSQMFVVSDTFRNGLTIWWWVFRKPQGRCRANSTHALIKTWCLNTLTIYWLMLHSSNSALPPPWSRLCPFGETTLPHLSYGPTSTWPWANGGPGCHLRRLPYAYQVDCFLTASQSICSFELIFQFLCTWAPSWGGRTTKDPKLSRA